MVEFWMNDYQTGQSGRLSEEVAFQQIEEL